MPTRDKYSNESRVPLYFTESLPQSPLLFLRNTPLHRGLPHGPSPTAGKAGLAACQATALQTTAPVLADALPLGFESLGPWTVHRSVFDPERLESSESASD